MPGQTRRRLRPRPLVPADQLQRSAAVQASVRPRAGAPEQSRRGAASRGQEQHEERGEDREPREQHHCGAEEEDSVM